VKIIYIAIIGFLATSLFDFSINTGGKIAHIGGALFGYLFTLQYRKGRDITRGFNRLLTAFFGLFKPRPKVSVSYKKSESDHDFNRRKKDEQAAIDRILDKIAKSGYDSLTKEEKEILFRQSQS